MIKGGPKIINDGLVLCLDAHDAKSYAGEPTTNVVTNTNLDTGWSKGYQSNIVYNDIEPPLGIDSQVVGHTRGSSSAYWYSYGDYAPQDPSVVYVVSMYVKTLDSNFRIAFYTADNSETGRYWSTYITVPNDGKWHRVVWPSFTNPSNSQSDSLSFNFAYNGAIGDSSTKTWFCAPQMEAKSYATPFVDGSRSATNGWVDRSGNSNNGTLTNMIGTEVTHYRDGQVIMPVANSYLDFDGSNDRVQISHSTQLNNAKSWEIWFKIDSFPDTSTYDSVFSKTANWNQQGGILLSLIYGNLRFSYGGYWADLTIESISNMNTNTWYQVVGTGEYTGSGILMKGYLNGVYKGSLTRTAAFVPTNTNALYLGFGNGGTMNGQIAIFRVYEQTLTAAEVLSNYNATKGRF